MQCSRAKPVPSSPRGVTERTRAVMDRRFSDTVVTEHEEVGGRRVRMDSD